MLTKLERLKKAVVDTEAAYEAAFDAANDAANAAWDAAWDAADAWEAATYAAWSKAKLALAEYLKEQQDNG